MSWRDNMGNKYSIKDNKKEYECWFKKSQGAIFLYCAEVKCTFFKMRHLGYEECVCCVVTTSGWGYDEFKELMNKEEPDIAEYIRSKMFYNGRVGNKFEEIENLLKFRCVIK